MKTCFKVFIIAAIILPCSMGDSQAQQALDAADVPDWCIPLPVSPDEHYACGIAEQPSLNQALTVAEVKGRYQLAEQVRSDLRSYSQLIVEEVAVNDSSMLREDFTRVIESVVPLISLEESEPRKHEILQKGDQYIAFALMAVPRQPYRQAFLSKLTEQSTLYDFIKETPSLEKLKQDANRHKESQKHNKGSGH